MLKKFLDSNPAFIILLVIIIGYLWANYIEPSLGFLTILLILGLLISLILLLKKHSYSVKFILAFSIGVTLNFYSNFDNISIPSKVIPEMKSIFIGNIEKKLFENDKLIRILCRGKIDAQSLDCIDNSNLIINVFKRTDNFQLINGQQIYAKVKINFPQTNQFENSFDQKQYLKSLNANFSALGNSKDISILSEPSLINKILNNIILDINARIDLLFKDYTNATIKAVILGDKSGLTSELKEIYSLSGTAHVLAVSGLHTGIIASIIFVFLGFVSNRIVKLIIFTIGISFFVVISGMQDSAIRAAVLAICLLFAYTFQYRYTLLNVFSFAVLLIILFNPSILYSTGFQMSIGSVAGIIIFYEPIQKFFKRIFLEQNKLMSFIINSFTVTLAASIIISPIVAYYFGIYSFVSPLTNLIIIPIFSFILIFGIISLLFSFISIEFASYYSEVANFLIKISESINYYSISLPNSYMIDNSALIISIIISLVILYIINSYNGKAVIFRIIISLSIIILSIFVFESDLPKTGIIARKQFSSLIMPLKNDLVYVMIADRKPSQIAKRDFEFENYLISLNKKLIIAYNGNAGINLCDNLKKQIPIAQKEISLKQVEYIERKLKINFPISQFIGLKE